MITHDRIRVPESIVGTDPGCGAVVTFVGVVRPHNGGRSVTGMTYECYDEMAGREIDRIIDEAKAGHAIERAQVIHRIGDLSVGEISLLVIVGAAHRVAAFDASQWIVDEIKKRVPIWKKEHYADATSAWL